jgi:hypothetical protein
MVRQADLSPTRAGSAARSSSRRATRTGAFLLWTWTTLCSRRRSRARARIGERSPRPPSHSPASPPRQAFPRTGRSSPSSVLYRAAPPRAPWSKREVLVRLPIPRGHPPPRGRRANYAAHAASLSWGRQGSIHRTGRQWLLRGGEQRRSGGAAALGRSGLGPGQSSVAPEATDPDLPGGRMTTCSRIGAARRFGRTLML